MTSTRRNPTAGMSLLEVLVALAVMALIALILASGLGTAARVLGRGSGFSAQVESALNRRQLRDWIERASGRAFPGMDYTGLSGTNDKLVVEVLPVDGFYWAGSPMIATITATPDGQITVHTVGQVTPDQRREMDFALSGTGAGLAITYYGPATPNALPTWQDSWTAEKGLPLLVKLTASNPQSGFPPLVIEPAKIYRQREMSLSSLLPPIRPSRP